MRKVTFGGAVSLDNFIAGPEEEMDWLLWSSDANKIMTDYWKTIDTMLMGRKTYEFATRSGQGGSSYPGIKTYVCSRTLPVKKDESFEVVKDAVKLVRKLKRQKGKDICIMGGGDLANSLFDAKLIDEVGLNIHPVLLGGGIPTFLPLKRRIKLELIECRPIQHGCAYFSYRVK